MSNLKDKDLLIIHLGSLGDIVITFPVILILRGIYRNVHIMCPGQQGRLAVDLGLADKCLSTDTALFASLYSGRTDTELKKVLTSYQEILLFSFSDQLLQSIEDVMEGHVYHIPPRPEAHKRIHVGQHLMDRLEECGLIKEHDRNRYEFQASLNARTKGCNPSCQGRILIHPGSGSRRKCWPIQNFLKLEEMLRAEGLRPKFIIGPADHVIEKTIREKHGHKSRVHVIDDPLKLLSLLKSVQGYIGNDSGVSHLSAFIGIATLVIFGPSDPIRWRPSGRTVQIVRPELECSPCFETEQANCESQDCIYKTLPETVFDASLGLFKTASNTK